MKNITLLFMLISGLAFGQFTVKETSNDWKLIGKHYNNISFFKKDGKAKLVYLDYNTANEKININIPTVDYTFEFSTDAETLDKLYTIIKEHFDNNKVETLTLQFAEGKMYLEFYKSLISYNFAFLFDADANVTDKNSSFKRRTYPLKMNDVNRLFGKK